MAANRTLYLAGPCYVVRGDLTIVSQGDVVCTPVLESFQVSDSVHGELADRKNSSHYDITFTPCGVVETARMGDLWAHRNASGYTLFGQSIYGATDIPTVIYDIDGKSHTFHCTGIAKMPDITIKAGTPPLGDMLIRAILRNNYEPTDVAALVTHGTQAWNPPATDATDIPTGPARAAWGAVSPWDAIESKEGWKISFNMGLFDVMNDSSHIIDQKLNSLSVTCSATPVPTDAAIGVQEMFDKLPMQGAGAYRGASMTGDNLVITSLVSGGLIVTLTKATPTAASAKWGLSTDRNGEMTWKATRDGSAALFTVSLLA